MQGLTDHARFNGDKKEVFLPTPAVAIIEAKNDFGLIVLC